MKPPVKWTLLAALLALASGSMACDKGGGDEACQPLRTALTEALTAADAATAVFRPAIQAAAESPPAVGMEACPATDLRHRSGLPVLPAEELASYEPGVVRTLRQGHAPSLERMIESCEVYPPELREQALAELATDLERLRTGYELVLVELHRVAPVLVQSGQFTPGQVRVRGLVWSFADQAVVCAGEATATNRDEVQTTHQRHTQSYLDDDLNDRAAIQVFDALRATAL